MTPESDVLPSGYIDIELTTSSFTLSIKLHSVLVTVGNEKRLTMTAALLIVFSFSLKIFSG